MMSGTAAPLVWINGFPGSGKLTVATALATLDGSIVVLDNHMLIDPVEARFSREHPRYQQERKVYRTAMLDKHVCNTAQLEHIVVFTGR
jgi:adenylylsulfate kinase-like enzyme